MSGYEQQLLTRAEVLEEAGELTQAITAILAGAQRAGVDPAAVTSLAAAARALDPGASTSYDAGGKDDRRPGGGYESDAAMLEAVSAAEDDVRERLREVRQLRERVLAALDAALEALAAARAMTVKEKCDGCHAARAAAISAAEVAIADAEERIRTCEAAAGLLDPLAARLQQALDRLRAVPQDLGEVYQLVYEFIRKGGKLPVFARWIEGEGTRA